MQVDPLLCPVLCQRVCTEFFHEKFRPRQTEPIDTLFHISHHKYIVAPGRYGGDTGQDRLLYQIAVLILVDHNLLKLLLILSRYRRRNRPVFRLFCQYLQRILLHIREINHIPGALLLLVSIGKFPYKLRQLLHRRPACLYILYHPFRILVKILSRQILHDSLDLIPDRLNLSSLLFRDRLILIRGKPRPGDAFHDPGHFPKIMDSKHPLHNLPVFQ